MAIANHEEWAKLIEGVLEERLSDFQDNFLQNFPPSLTSSFTEECFKLPKKMRMPEDKPEFSFKSDVYPAANVDIYKSRSKESHYTIKVGDRKVGGIYPSLAIAKAFAEPMHKKLVDALVAENPKFGSF